MIGAKMKCLLLPEKTTKTSQTQLPNCLNWLTVSTKTPFSRKTTKTCQAQLAVWQNWLFALTINCVTIPTVPTAPTPMASFLPYHHPPPQLPLWQWLHLIAAHEHNLR